MKLIKSEKKYKGTKFKKIIIAFNIKFFLIFLLYKNKINYI